MRLLPKRLTIDNIGAILTVVSALFFSYLPFIYLTNAAGIPKAVGFIAILALGLFIALIRLAKFNFQISRPAAITFLLYVPFLLYAANSFVWHINYLNDYQTVLVITLINPIMIFLAVTYNDKKEIMLKTILVLSAVYFVFVMRAAVFGNLLTTDDFTRVFSFVSSDEYQNINIYLGFFLILLWIFPIFKNIVWIIFKLALSPLILMLMFAVGGRASIVAAVVVLFMLLYLSQLSASKKMTITLILVAMTILVILHLHQFLPGVDLLGIRRFEVLWTGDDSSERIFLFSHAWQLFMLNPWNIFFGAGMNAFPIYIGRLTTGMYPHNLVLELLAEYGVIGLILFMTPIYYLLLVRKRTLGVLIGRTAAEKGSFYIFLYLLLESMFTGGLFNSWMLIFFIFMTFPEMQTSRYPQREPLLRHDAGRLHTNTRPVNIS